MASKPLVALMLLAGACAPSAYSQFRQTLAAQDSATAALTQWCAARGLAAEPIVRASLLRAQPAAPPADLGQRLGTSPTAQPGYRHVQLSCGGKVLSEAHNWYRRDLLTPKMNATLDRSDVPFGRAVAALNFRRERQGEARGAAFGCPAGTLLSHQARLILTDGQPLAYVVECYTRANLWRGN